MAFIPDPVPPPSERHPWVGHAYLTLLGFCLVWILLWGCAGSQRPPIELASEQGAVRSGQSTQLFLIGEDGRRLDPPAGVTWEVNGVPGGSPFYGQVDGEGTYRAPEVAQAQRFVIRLVRREGERPASVIATGEIEVLPREPT